MNTGCFEDLFYQIQTTGAAATVGELYKLFQRIVARHFMTSLLSNCTAIALHDYCGRERAINADISGKLY